MRRSRGRFGPAEEIKRAEETARHDRAAALKRAEAAAPRRDVDEAFAVAAHTGRKRVELEQDLVRAFKEGRVAEWSRGDELREATACDQKARAHAEALLARHMEELNRNVHSLWRMLCLKAELQDAAREAHGFGGKKAARAKKSQSERMRVRVERIARTFATQRAASRATHVSRSTLRKYWPK